ISSFVCNGHNISGKPFFTLNVIVLFLLELLITLTLSKKITFFFFGFKN
mgnify:CR=1